MLALRLIAGPQPGKKIVVHAGQSYTIGRTEASDIALDDWFLSGRHFELKYEQQTTTIHDLGSRNGTFLNGNQVSQAQLTDGDVVRAGSCEFLVERQKSHSDVHVRSPNGARSTSVDKPSERIDPPQPLRASHASSALIQTLPSLPVPRPPAGTITTSVHLEVLSKSHNTRRLWIRPGVSLTIGASTQADVTFDDDQTMSRVHLRVTLQNGDLRVKDLNSTNGVRLNGTQISDATLRHGDIVLAGSTQFRVVVDSNPQDVCPERRSWKSQLLPSGMLAFTPTADASLPLDVLRGLMACTPMMVVVTPPVEVSLKPFSTPLFNWLPERATNVSPRVFRQFPGADLLGLVERHWGQDRVACILSGMDSESIFPMLSVVARGQTRATAVPDLDFIISDWRPSELTKRLVSQPAEACRPFLNATAIFVEADQGASWTLVAPPQFEAVLNEAVLIECIEKPRATFIGAAQLGQNQAYRNRIRVS